MNNLKDLVREATQAKGISGITALCKHCDLEYRQVIKVWNGDNNAKLSHVERVFNTLGYQLKAVKNND